MIEFLLERFRANAADDAIIWKSDSTTYGDLVELIAAWDQRLDTHGINGGDTVAVYADFNPQSISLMLSLIGRRCICVPLSIPDEAQRQSYLSLCAATKYFEITGEGHTFTELDGGESPEVLEALRTREHPGLILFSSGSTGTPKGIVNDFKLLLDKYRVQRKPIRALSFLLFDHIGGVNTALSILSSLGCIVTIEQRTPDEVCQAIEAHAVDVLPTSPTFLNLLLLSKAYEANDISSLKVMTYGTEAMPQSTLDRLHAQFPDIRLKQTYGMSEVGILATKSKDSGSLWMKMGGEGYETRVIDGMLEIKAQAAMLGYINAASPFTEDGWMKTGDAVEVDGEYFRVLGRKSELINIGGQKVYPTEVEGFLETIDGVEEVVVSGEAHPIMGFIVKAQVRLSTDETSRKFKKRMHAACAGKLEAGKIPQKVVLSETKMHGDRFKKMRR